jgi:hypothetical protein
VTFPELKIFTHARLAFILDELCKVRLFWQGKPYAAHDYLVQHSQRATIECERHLSTNCEAEQPDSEALKQYLYPCEYLPLYCHVQLTVLKTDILWIQTNPSL